MYDKARLVKQNVHAEVVLGLSVMVPVSGDDLHNSEMFAVLRWSFAQFQATSAIVSAYYIAR